MQRHRKNPGNILFTASYSLIKIPANGRFIARNIACNPICSKDTILGRFPECVYSMQLVEVLDIV